MISPPPIAITVFPYLHIACFYILVQMSSGLCQVLHLGQTALPSWSSRVKHLRKDRVREI